MKNILVFNHSFFVISETFIHQQIVGLEENNNLCLVSYANLNEDKFPVKGKKIRLERHTSIIDKILSKVFKELLGTNGGISFFNKLIVRRIIQENKIDIIHAHFGPSAIAILPVAKSLKIPLIVSFHGLDASPEMLDDISYSRHLADLFDYAQTIIIVSLHMIETLNLYRWQEKIRLVVYGTNYQAFTRSGKRPSELDGRIRILHSGRLVGKKGVPDLIRVFLLLCNRYENLVLDIVGDGVEMPICDQLVKNSNYRTSIHFYGAQSQAFVKKMMNDADIFVLNCRTADTGDMEGTPVSILEAMSMNLPVVSTFHAGVPGVIQNNLNGILVAERHQEQLYSAIESLVKSPALREKLGNNARETIVNKFGVEIMQSKLSELFK